MVETLTCSKAICRPRASRHDCHEPLCERRIPREHERCKHHSQSSSARGYEVDVSGPDPVLREIEP